MIFRLCGHTLGSLSEGFTFYAQGPSVRTSINLEGESASFDDPPVKFRPETFFSVVKEPLLVPNGLNQFLLTSPVNGLVVGEVSIMLRRSGTDIRVPRNQWLTWLNGSWRDHCRPELEQEAVSAILPQLKELQLPVA